MPFAPTCPSSPVDPQSGTTPVVRLQTNVMQHKPLLSQPGTSVLPQPRTCPTLLMGPAKSSPVSRPGLSMGWTPDDVQRNGCTETSEPSWPTATTSPASLMPVVYAAMFNGVKPDCGVHLT